jgi:hypothetical protein
MLSALISFLGGSVFRMIFGEVASYFQKKQDHAHELARMEFQRELEREQHERMQAALKTQHEMGIKTIEVQGEQTANAIEMQGWANAVANATATTGVFIVDLWNGVIRPSAATIALFLWVLALNSQSWKMNDWDQNLVGVILGFFFANRAMQKNGK